MVAVERIPKEYWTLMASAVLHAGVFAFLLVRGPMSERVPIGVEIQYGSPASVRPSLNDEISALKPKSKPRVRKEKVEAAPTAAQLSQPATNASASVQDGPAGRADGVVVSELERYKYELRQYLESRKIYPEHAKRLRQTGTVVVKFKVSAAGELQDVQLNQATSSESLNRAAMEMVKRAAKFKPLPEQSGVRELELTLPIAFVL